METDLFTPQDAAALLSIRAARSHPTLSPDELLAAFEALGLMRDPDAAPLSVQAPAALMRISASRRLAVQ